MKDVTVSTEGKRKRKSPSQGEDENKGVYKTPREFLLAVDSHYLITFDIAANKENNVVSKLRAIGEDDFFSEEQNALKQNWPISRAGYNWLNPPYSNINEWVSKTLVLVPLTRANWWRDWVNGKCLEIDLIGRMSFMENGDPYPKDLMLLVYGDNMIGQCSWDWRKDKK